MAHLEYLRAQMTAQHRADQSIGNETPRSPKLATVAGVDLNVDPKTTLYTVPAGMSCIVTHVIIRLASANLTTANYGFGFDANATDVIAAATHTELTGNTLYTVLYAKAGAKLGAATNVFGVKCATKQGGASTVTIDVYGRIF